MLPAARVDAGEVAGKAPGLTAGAAEAGVDAAGGDGALEGEPITSRRPARPCGGSCDCGPASPRPDDVLPVDPSLESHAPADAA